MGASNAAVYRSIGNVNAVPVYHDAVLDVLTFGRLSVRRFGKDLQSPPRRAFRLFSFLLCNRSHSATKERIAQNLWPQSITAAKNLHAAAHDLRKWAADDRALHFADDCYSLSVHVDADEFELRMGAARRPPGNGPVFLEEELNAILSIYSGRFLPGDESSWATQRRRRLEGILCDALVMLSRLALERKSPEQALEWIERAAEVMPHREDTLRERMLTLGALGRRSEALRLYQAFSLKLRAELGCSPDPMTIAIQGELSK